MKRARSMISTYFCDRSIPKRQTYNKCEISTHATVAQNLTPIPSCHAKAPFRTTAQPIIAEFSPQEDSINFQPLFGGESQLTMTPLAKREENQHNEARETLKFLQPSTKLPISNSKKRLLLNHFNLNDSNADGIVPGRSDILPLDVQSCKQGNSKRKNDIQQQQQTSSKVKKESTFVPRNFLEIPDLPATNIGNSIPQQIHQQCRAFDKPDMYKYGCFDSRSSSFVYTSLGSASPNVRNSTAPKVSAKNQFGMSMSEYSPEAQFQTPPCDKIFEYETILYCPNFSDDISYGSTMNLYI
mmetsp:Transcript_54012/g.63130  ORF Transcript_54012/g.63130 Transcript_54012/m.63130 type:complete len:298 (+) Transcript_54012:408-1301(+)